MGRLVGHTTQDELLFDVVADLVDFVCPQRSLTLGEIIDKEDLAATRKHPGVVC